MADRKTLAVIGCGQMAGALLGGMKKRGKIPPAVFVYDIEPERQRSAAALYGGREAASARAAAQAAGIILLAVKPAQVAQVLREIAPALREEQLLISIAAGVSLQAMGSEIDRRLPLVRVMPNTPCLVGKGAAAVSFSPFVAPADRELVIDLFTSVGIVREVTEGYMDAVTAVSGSGPAYVFMMAEALTDAAVEAGLPRDLARDLVHQTLEGSAAMLVESGRHPADLREMVTSPGGTTIAAIRALEEHGLRAAFFAAVEAACRRSRILGGKTVEVKQV